MDPNEEVARLRAELDQAREGAREYAPYLWSFYEESVKSGFTPDQAFALTMRVLTVQLGNAGGDTE